MLNSIKLLFGAVLLACVAAELENDGPGQGEKKKEAAKTKLIACVDPLLPDNLNPLLKPCAGFIIDAAVAFLNRTGFFASLLTT